MDKQNLKYYNFCFQFTNTPEKGRIPVAVIRCSNDYCLIYQGIISIVDQNEYLHCLMADVGAKGGKRNNGFQIDFNSEISYRRLFLFGVITM
jgi:hypothetical protein